MRRAAIWALGLALFGCGAVRHQVDFARGVTLDERLAVEVGTVANQSGKVYDLPVEQMMRDALSQKLSEVKLLWSDPAVARHVILTVQIVDYERGDAFKRWLMPGYGTTVLSVRGELTDTSKGTLVGTVEARRTVSAGGAYTIGAWRTIFNDVAEDVAEDLEKGLAQPALVSKP